MNSYSKEVMKRFKNPKFAKEMKNADAVGEVGNVQCGDVMKIFLKISKNKKGEEIIKNISYQTYGCLPSKEKIVIGGEWVDIDNLKEHDSVLNGDGRKSKVKKRFSRSYNGFLLKFIPFVSPFNSFYTTPEHPILCIQRNQLKKISRHPKCPWLRIDHNELLSTKPYYQEAGNLKEGDYLIFSVSQEIKNNKTYNKSFLRLIGYYLSEGYLTAKGNVVAFAFHKNEKHYIDEVKNLIKDIIEKEAKIRVRNNVAEIYVCSRNLANKLLKIAGKLARKKKLSEDIMLLPPIKQLELIKTYANGDGDRYFRRKTDSVTYRLATASEKLAIQLQEILARNNIFSSIAVRKRKNNHSIEGRRIIGKDLFIISYKKERKHKFVHKTRGYFLVPIRKIERKEYKGKVYNFEVSSEPNSYLVKGFVVHNCVAAISSSDALCELAKGKTIEEALKLNRNDILKKLKGLPNIKFHCSVLGEKALHKAIENYKKKR